MIYFLKKKKISFCCSHFFEVFPRGVESDNLEDFTLTSTEFFFHFLDSCFKGENRAIKSSSESADLRQLVEASLFSSSPWSTETSLLEFCKPPCCSLPPNGRCHPRGRRSLDCPLPVGHRPTGLDAVGAASDALSSS
jgi:hypothetical protein